MPRQVLRTSRFRIALPQQAARALLHHDYSNDSTTSRMRFLYVLHLSLSVAIPGIQPRLRLSGTNRLRSTFHGGQWRKKLTTCSRHWLRMSRKVSSRKVQALT
ncbi:MAG: hypothetical protein KZQ66_16055 [Candidatus Thiodiazotropha sp. (ex Lucinoma aequizonata)]|nr:hypothetical protein [Candidatus Thiodiazotropha sp. (ex Lucinoma aequizonata)]MCU7893553.1 hypothetical protein [Candidatus Thiodiazotropha sp. (ex Lucinoma aequizonata)]MCU7895489.1 hypothetical protein [Candidatus Thiodiazotropha sp. (ex Lucinoma aequizonata)]MCU7903315.1 hypothetical protein [Candidatus Thiodiazotropha sp. (ex Lucinoma aequizonata)]MCU7908187.1 hypothetical protein [Candidatus Thiodiazotropha sp. (ex Lucinoma aequizonata)]